MSGTYSTTPITLLATDQNLNVLGDPLDGWTDLSSTRNHLIPDSSQVTVPARPEYMALLQPGNRMVCIYQGKVWSAGPLEIPDDYEWGVGGDVSEPAPGKTVFNWTNDLGRIAGYLVYPDPSKPFEAQDTATDALRNLTANAETAIRQLVNENCGPGAIAQRRIPRLVLDAVASVGSTVTVSSRFDNILDVCRTAASTDNLGFRTREVDGEIRFGVFAPTDRTATARFSAGLGNLRSVAFKRQAPTATAELVQGGDAGSREYVEINSAAETEWYRIEKLVDQSGTTDADGELTQAGNNELTTDDPQVSLATVTVDTEDLQAMRDFDLGDLVTVELPTGLEVVDLVRSMTLAAQPNSGAVITSVVGTQDATTDSRITQIVRNFARRLGRLETR